MIFESAGNKSVYTLLVLPSSGTALQKDTVYNVTATVGTYKFVAPSDGWAHGTFTTGTSPSITFESGAAFLGEVPEFEASTKYEFDVNDGVWAFGAVVTE